MKYQSTSVSIPQSGFWVFKPLALPAYGFTKDCFNPSVGILGVQASSVSSWKARWGSFQSLSRDSGCSSACWRRSSAWPTPVSIPQSGFWVFKPPARPRSRRGLWSFNPSVGILGVQAFAFLHLPFGVRVVSIPQSGFWVFKRA